VALAAAALPDAQIESDIRARLAKSKISTNHFQVKVRNGVAVLTGKTEVPQHKGVATRLAKAGGAVKVDNRIEISEAARAQAAERLARAREKQKVNTRTLPRSEPRAAHLAEEPSVGAPPLPATPPVRRAVVRH
jgi:hypothetical protein